MQIKLRSSRLTSLAVNQTRFQLGVIPAGASRFVIAAFTADRAEPPVVLSFEFQTEAEADLGWKDGFSVDEAGFTAAKAIVEVLLDRGLAKRVSQRHQLV